MQNSVKRSVSLNSAMRSYVKSEKNKKKAKLLRFTYHPSLAFFY